ncbi:hypothetical protein PN4B1_29960 [Paenibacillus naphthalenovorans]|nr:hypothetical protein PN4B1_29960 [Paenibacillus naphthalenovorans]
MFTISKYDLLISYNVNISKVLPCCKDKLKNVKLSEESIYKKNDFRYINSDRINNIELDLPIVNNRRCKS